MARNLLLFALLLAGSLAASASEPGPPGTGSTHPIHFSGRVVDTRGRPAGGAVIYVSLNDRPAAAADRPPPPRIGRTTAAADGSFRLAVSAAGKDWSATVVAIREGQGPGGVDVGP